MGQYWKPVNLDKKEYVNPHKLGAGLKLWEQLANAPGVGAALIVLTAAMPERRGGGDLALSSGADPAYDEIAARTIGRWAGDRIAIVGDYAENSDLPAEHEASTIYGRCISIEAQLDGESGPDTPLAYFYDITADVARVIEYELDGKFVGDQGWREWKPSA